MRRDYARLEAENRNLQSKISLNRGNFGRELKELNEKCSDLENRNQTLREENKQLNEKLRRAEGVVNAVEELRRYVYIFRENFDALTEKISDTVSRANFNEDEDD